MGGNLKPKSEPEHVLVLSRRLRDLRAIASDLNTRADDAAAGLRSNYRTASSQPDGPSILFRPTR